jgi:hypothetical protein
MFLFLYMTFYDEMFNIVIFYFIEMGSST